MVVGTVREIKVKENRVGLTPDGVSTLRTHGHEVLVERDAGLQSGFTNEIYEAAGARIAASAQDVWEQSALIVKVKEPQQSEFPYLSERTMLFTYLHLAAAEELTRELLARRVTAIAYETVELDDGSLPLLVPMSMVAGRMATQIGAHYLERTNGGSGKLLGGVPGVPSAKVSILGTGIVGLNAAKMAVGMGASVVMLGRNLTQLSTIDDLYQGRIHTRYSTPSSIGECVAASDLLIGAIAVTGEKAAKLVSRDMVRQMSAGSVLVDVAIDQGGCSETSRVTTHDDPTYLDESVIHYCVSNMPGAVPNTSTLALTNATLPYIVKVADAGVVSHIVNDKVLSRGVNTYAGQVTNDAVASAFGLKSAHLA